MPEDRIENLLRQADRQAGTVSATSADMASRVRHQARRRRTRIRTGMSVAAVLVVSVGLYASFLRIDGTEEDPASTIATATLSADEVAQLREEIAELRAKADAALARIEQLKASQARTERMVRLDRTPMDSEPFKQVQAEIERSAYLMMLQAERWRHTPTRRASVVNAYQRVIRSFPRTRWAKVAEDRLAEMNRSKGDVL